jgi:hypothetical protein
LGGGVNNNVNYELIYEDKNEYSEESFNIIKKIIDNTPPSNILINLFPFVSYNDTYIISRKLNNDYRITSPTNKLNELLFDKDGIISIQNKKWLMNKIKNVVKWINEFIWNQSFIHGDLTDNNFIFDYEITQEFIIIDWAETMNYIPNNEQFILSCLIDMYDILNTFKKHFVNDEFDFIDLIYPIKEYEEKIKDNEYKNIGYKSINKTLLYLYYENIIEFKKHLYNFIKQPINLLIEDLL